MTSPVGSDLLSPLAAWPVDRVSASVVGARGAEPAVEEAYGDQDAVFELASVTKLLSAYAALVAVEEGAIELDGPAGPPGSTIRHLLAHTSGLAFEDRSVLSAPGAKRIYSSAGFEVLADEIAAVTGIAFADYLAEAVFEPLAMTSSSLRGSAGHGARASARDLAGFARELLAPTLIDASTLAQAMTVQFPGLDGILPGYGRQRPNDWGLGFEVRGSKSPHWTGSTNSARTVGHFGQSGTFLWVDPDIATVCVVLTDRPFGDWAKPLWSEVSDRVVAARAVPS